MSSWEPSWEPAGERLDVESIESRKRIFMSLMPGEAARTATSPHCTRPDQSRWRILWCVVVLKIKPAASGQRTRDTRDWGPGRPPGIMLQAPKATRQELVSDETGERLLIGNARAEEECS